MCERVGVRVCTKVVKREGGEGRMVIKVEFERVEKVEELSVR